MADIFINAPFDQDFLQKYEAYSTSLKQLTQILKKIADKEDLKDRIDILLGVHKKVEDRLVKEKECLLKDIRTTICREHVRHKYYSKTIKSTLVDRQS